MTEESELLQRGPCPQCSSTDANGLYDDGHSYCYSCGHYEKGSEDTMEKDNKPTRDKSLLQGEPFNVSRRGISLDTFGKFKYQQSVLKGEKVHIANYYKDGRVIAQKIRFKNKDFTWRGSPKECGLFGMQLWRDAGKRIIITEGEIDALSVSQTQQNKWPVVSIPNGAQGAKKDLAKHIAYLEKFEEIILCFDMDDPGRASAKECVLLFTPGKAKIVSLPLKDANEMLKAGRSSELVSALWDAKSERPDGVMSGAEVLEKGNEEPEWGLSWPWGSMTKWTYGIRVHEMYAYGAGTGSGKTDILKRIVGHLIKEHQQKVGTLLLEEPQLSLSMDTIAGQIDGAFYHLPDVEVNDEQKDETRLLISKYLEMYKVGGPLDTDAILIIIRYMVVGLGCTQIILDHVTYVLDGVADSDQNAEMKKLMRSLNDLNKELPFSLHYVSHLRKSKGVPHEEGGRVTLDDFVGGKAVTQYANFAFGIERNQQAEEVEDRDYSTVRNLKARFSGHAIGNTMSLQYNRSTGQKNEVDINDNSDTDNSNDYF